MKRVALWILGAAVAVLLAWGALHVVISPIESGEEPPEGHFSAECWACHIPT